MARRGPPPQTPEGRFDWVALLLGSLLLTMAAVSCFGFGRDLPDGPAVEAGP